MGLESSRGASLSAGAGRHSVRALREQSEVTGFAWGSEGGLTEKWIERMSWRWPDKEGNSDWKDQGVSKDRSR